MKPATLAASMRMLAPQRATCRLGTVFGTALFMAAMGCSTLTSNAPDNGAAGRPYVYVSGGTGEILIFRFDAVSGTLAPMGSADGGDNPSYLAVAPNQKTLYALNEKSSGEVIAFSIDAARDGALTEIDRESSGGDGPAHLAVHPSGRWLAVANYASGHTAILPISADGRLGAASDIDRGPTDGCTSAHQVVFDASGQHLLVPCLGSGYVVQFVFANGLLSYNEPATVPVEGGPRHLALSGDGLHGYVLSELSSRITSFAYDAPSGRLTSPQTVDSYVSSAGGSAHIAVHPAGAFLYASNRGENSLGSFTLTNGRPVPKAFVRDLISTPRDFALDPSGTFLIAANQRGAQDLLVFAIDRVAGTLTRKHVVPAGNAPTCVVFVSL